MYPALDTLESLVNSDLMWGVRSFGGWQEWFKDSKVRAEINKLVMSCAKDIFIKVLNVLNIFKTLSVLTNFPYF